MVNREVQTPVLLDGVGFVARKNRDYNPGEYRRLSNVKLENGSIISRNNVRTYKMEGESYSNMLGNDAAAPSALGNYGHWTLYSDMLKQFAYTGSGFKTNMFNPQSIDSTYVKACYFIEYNNKAYWVFQGQGNTFNYFDVVYCSSDLSKDPSKLGTSSNSINKPSSHSVQVETSDSVSTGFGFKAAFISKERLWICSSGAIYFSKPTDPTEFRVSEGGGFFNFPSDQVNYLIDGKDTLYVICESSIYTITYNSDPNVDAVVRKISSDTGGLHGCAYGDAVYFINTLGLYAITNNRISFVMESNLDEGINDFDSQKLTSYGKYIYINKTYVKNLNVEQGPSGPTVTEESEYNYMPDNMETWDDSWDWHADSYSTNYTVEHDSEYDTVTLETLSNFDARSFKVDQLTKIEVVGGQSYFWASKSDVDMINVNPIGNNNSVWGLHATITAYDANKNRVIGGVPKNRVDMIRKYTFHTGSGFSQATPSQFYDITFTPKPGVKYVSITYQLKYMGGQLPAGGVYTLRWKLGQTFITDVIHNKSDDSYERFFGTKVGTTNNDYTYSYVTKPWGKIIKKSITHSSASVESSSFYKSLTPWMPWDTIKGNNLGYNTYCLNMETGAVHVVDFKPLYDSDEYDYSYGYIYDIYYNPSIDPVTGKPSLMLAVNNRYQDLNNNENLSNSGISSVFYLHEDNNVYDNIINIKNDLLYSTNIKPNYEIEVDSFTPDGTEYLMKKFRGLELMGTLPDKEFVLEVAYDNNDYSKAVELIDNKDNLENLRANYPHRIGLNQRAQSMSIRLKSIGLDYEKESGNDYTYDYLAISDINILWTYTQRGQKYSSYSNKV